MSADVWAYSLLVKTNMEEYKNKYQKTEEFRHNYFDVVLVEGGYQDAEKKSPGIMKPFKVGEMYAVTDKSVVYQGNLGDSNIMEDFIEALLNFVDESIDEEDAFSQLEHIIEYDMLIGTDTCEELCELMEDNQSEFASWCKQNGCARQFNEIYAVLAHAMSVAKHGGCVLIG